MPYRDDRRALEARRDDLRRELDELRLKTEALREVVHAREAVERDLHATEARLAQIDARRASLIDDVRIASPCNVSWDAMKGDDRVRFCGECAKNVYNLSALSRDEATRLLAEREGSICVRLYRRADGTALTADCPVGVRRKRVRLALYGAAGAGALTAAAAWSATMCVMGETSEPSREVVMMGAVPAMHDSYVPQPLDAKPEDGLVFVYHQEPRHGKPEVQWHLWADGRAARATGGKSPPPDTPLPAAARAAAQEILALARELRPEARGAVPAHVDSAVPHSYELFGTGTREATDFDRAKLFDLAARLSSTAENP
jgi:hypothetical protein